MKILYITCGFLLFGIGVTGVILPILPTTPFLLAAGFCFAKGSKRLSRWFLSTKLYKKYLADFEKNRSLSLKTKAYILAMASAMLILAFIFSGNLHARILVAVVFVLKYYVFLFRIKTTGSTGEKNKLISLAPGTKKLVAGSVLINWIGLLCNITFVLALSLLLEQAFSQTGSTGDTGSFILIAAGCAALRFVCTVFSKELSAKISARAKRTLRERLYQKLLRLSLSYREKVSASEVLQTAVEGIEQLDGYFSRYLPQLGYSISASATLALILAFINVRLALILFCCALLIPLSLVLFRTIAGRLFHKYWGSYTDLGRSFLDNLQGLTTLKIYSADEYKNAEMNREAEEFRKITMRVLKMQLGSIGLMDIMAYGGIAAGVFLSVRAVRSEELALWGGVCIILFSAELFLPLRQLGSFFHVAANGVAASKRVFRLLALPEDADGEQELLSADITLSRLSFSYGEKEVLSDISVKLPEKGVTGLVGRSGSGKSTLAAILSGSMTGYGGSVRFGAVELREIKMESRCKKIAYVGQESYLFSGSAEETLRMGNTILTKEQIKAALLRVDLLSFVQRRGGLDFYIREDGSNLSGGQRQRFILARALLHGGDFYIFDEATASVDAESEKIIMDTVYSLRGEKTVLLISHRLENVKAADVIYVLQDHKVAERGTHAELMSAGGIYAGLYGVQNEIEEFVKGGGIYAAAHH